MKWMRGYGTKLVWNLGFRVPSSNHPNIQTPNKSTKIDTTTRLYDKTLFLWTKKLGDVHVQCTVKALSEKQVATSQVRLVWLNTRPYCEWISMSRTVESLHGFQEQQLTVHYPRDEGRPSNWRWSGQSTCSDWCRLDARCPSSCGKYRRVPRCPESFIWFCSKYPLPSENVQECLCMLTSGIHDGDIGVLQQRVHTPRQNGWCPWFLKQKDMIILFKIFVWMFP